MLISSLAINPGSPIFYDRLFRITLESYLTWLINDSSTQQINIDPQLAYKFEGDFFGLLLQYNIKPYLHWVIMRMNGLTSPLDSEADINTLLIPNDAVIEQIRQSYVSTNRITN